MTLREISAQMHHPFEVLEEGLTALPLAMEPEPFENAPQIIMYSDRPSPEQVLEMHEELEAEEPNDLEIVVEDLPGVEALDPELEKTLEVSDDAMSSAETLRAEDEEKSKAPKVNNKWNLMTNGPEGFIALVQEKLKNVPAHSGYDIAGCTRALAFLDKLADEVSKAMRGDIDGLLDANKVEEALAKIEEGADRLHERIEKIKSGKKSSRRKKKANEDDTSMVKEAQKSMPMGMMITVPLFISHIARVLINGTVSGGHDLFDMYKKQAEKYSLDKREKAELQQLLSDMGFPLPHWDRGYADDEDFDATSSDNYDLGANYQA